MPCLKEMALPGEETIGMYIPVCTREDAQKGLGPGAGPPPGLVPDLARYHDQRGSSISNHAVCGCQGSALKELFSF